MRVLVVEDEASLAAQVAQALRASGYAVDVAADGVEARYRGSAESYDLAILDLGLPRLDGLSVLREWRKSGVLLPVIILTARGSWSEKVAGMDGGADDYVAKPFQMEELLARARALLRRAHGYATTELACGPILLDTRTARVSVHGKAVPLTAHELKVLAYLMYHQGAVVSRSELTEHIYAQDYDRDSNTIEVFIGRLRRKLGPDSIETVRGLGYRLTPGER
jgi:two-component system OmpR family response regulator